MTILHRAGGLALLTLALAGAQDARAATTVSTSGVQLDVLAAPGRANEITVFLANPATLRVRDLGDTVAAGPGCAGVDLHTVDCLAAGILVADVDTWDLDDTVTKFAPLIGLLDGGPDDDTLRGGPSPNGGNDLRGGPGDDELVGGPDRDALDGGSGADELHGGPGVDHATYAKRAQPVTVTLDSAANDGQLNEGDLAAADIENVTGGRGADVLVGTGDGNVLTGGLGADALHGMGGDDTFVTRRLDQADTYNGGPGFDHVTYTRRPVRVIVDVDGVADDGEQGEGDNVRLDIERVTGGSRDDFLIGNLFANVLDGAAGADFLFGQGGADQLLGGPGDDRIEARDQIAGNDTVDGQSQTDTCWSDAGDVETNCEL